MGAFKLFSSYPCEKKNLDQSFPCITLDMLTVESIDGHKSVNR